MQRITGSLKIMAYGKPADEVDEYAAMSETAALESLKQFTRSVVHCFGSEYLRSPTSSDMERILRINTVRGFPGMAGSIDCQHYEWKNCPAQLAGQYKGKGKKPSIILEGIADGDLWLWYVFYGLPGSLNDLNVLDKSTTMGSILTGDFPPHMSYSVNGNSRSLLYLLADGIYPNFPIFVKSISNGGNSIMDKGFSKAQEAVRKDVERAFGVLISRWHILDHPLRLWYKKDIYFFVQACVILHNMIVEYRRDNHASSEYYDLSFEDPDASSISAESISFDRDRTMPETVNGTVRSWADRVASRNHEVMNEVEHFRLRNDLIQHIWSLRKIL